MTIRMTSKMVTFQRPFLLTGFDNVQAPGDYTVETEEEQVDAISFPVWKRNNTIIHLKNGVTTEYQPIDPDELQEALLRDGAQEDPAEAAGPETPGGRLRQAKATRFVRRKAF